MQVSQKILIVDDDPDFVEVARAILRTSGYRVASAYNSSEALTRMSEEIPDLVLLDVIMASPLEGVGLSQDMLRSDILRDVPIIMVTSIRSSEYRHAFPQDEYLHIDAWVDKPCSPAQLVSEVEKVLARRVKSFDAA